MCIYHANPPLTDTNADFLRRLVTTFWLDEKFHIECFICYIFAWSNICHILRWNKKKGQYWACRFSNIHHRPMNLYILRSYGTVCAMNQISWPVVVFVTFKDATQVRVCPKIGVVTTYMRLALCLSLSCIMWCAYAIPLALDHSSLFKR